MRRNGRQMITSNFVAAESHALLLNRGGRSIALSFLDSMEKGLAIHVRVTTEDESRAVQIIRGYTDKTFSLTDATSFAIADRLNIDTVFSFDADFSQYGLNVLRP
jgi:predicted nucleic acid-binding protein